MGGGSRPLRRLGVLGVLGVVGVLGLAGCGPRDNLAASLAPDVGPADRAQARCWVVKSRDNPLIIEWPGTERAALETRVRSGDHLPVVKYVGCDMEILPRCRAPGSYAYTAVSRKEERSLFRSADELYAKIPLSAARLEAQLERYGALSLAMTQIGTYNAVLAEAAALAPSALEGSCDGATHVVTGLSVGAFALESASGAAVGGGADVGGLGVGARSTHDRGFRRTDGDPTACDTGRGDAPPRECGSLLRVEVTPLAEPPAARPQRRADRRHRPCPEGSVLVEGGVYSPQVEEHSFWGGSGGNQSVEELCVGRHEVTVQEYRSCFREGACSEAPTTVAGVDEGEPGDDAGAGDSAACNGSRGARRHHPVNCVSYNQAASYCRVQGGRLPTAAEWEWIARGGAQDRTYPWGEDPPGAELVNACGRECSKAGALYDQRDGHRTTAPVGSFRRGRGRGHIEDLAGNVWEWTSSGESGSRRIRGGGFASTTGDDLRASGELRVDSQLRRADLGLRCVWEPTGEP